jgi:hypothetical protein
VVRTRLGFFMVDLSFFVLVLTVEARPVPGEISRCG